MFYRKAKLLSAAGVLFQLGLELLPCVRDGLAYGINFTAIRLLPGGRRTPEVRLARWTTLNNLATALHAESTVEGAETTLVLQGIVHVMDVLGGNHKLSNVIIDNDVGRCKRS